MTKTCYRVLWAACIAMWVIAAPRIFLEVLADATLATKFMIGTWLLCACGNAVGEMRRWSTP